jgi:hypothetical protein
MCLMALSSEPRFRVHHALRIKGFAKVEHVSDLSGLGSHHVNEHLTGMASDGQTQFREARGLWQLTPAGREAYPAALEADASRDGFRSGLAGSYHSFLELNEEFKALCGDWQLRDGAPNDHSNAKYDAGVLARLVALDGRAQPIASSFASVAERYEPYVPRLVSSLGRLKAGEQNMFTGVMVGSYHDVWMELHEDLILTQQIDRAAEGSF